MSKYPSVGWVIKDSDNADLSFTTSASTVSNWYSLDDAKYVGVALNVGTVTGTTPIMTAALECRFAGHATFTFAFPEAANSNTAAAAPATFSTTNDKMCKYWENPLPQSGVKGQFRIKFTVSGTTPVFPLDQAIAWKVAR